MGIIDGFRLINKLVVTNLKMTSGGGAGKVMTSDASGNVSLQTLAAAASDHMEATLTARDAISAGAGAFIMGGKLCASAYATVSGTAGYDNSLTTSGSDSYYDHVWLSGNYSLLVWRRGSNDAQASLVKYDDSANSFSAGTAIDVNTTSSTYTPAIKTVALNDYQALSVYWNGNAGGTSALAGRIITADFNGNTLSGGAQTLSTTTFYQGNGPIFAALIPGTTKVAVMVQGGSSNTAIELVIATVDPAADTISFSTSTVLESISSAAPQGIEFCGPNRIVCIYGAGAPRAVVVRHNAGTGLTVGTPATITSVSSGAFRAATCRASATNENRFLLLTYYSTNSCMKMRAFSVNNMSIATGTEITTTSSTVATANGQYPALIALAPGLCMGAISDTTSANTLFYCMNVNPDLSINYTTITHSLGVTYNFLHFCQVAIDTYALSICTPSAVPMKAMMIPKAPAYAASAISAAASGTVTIAGIVSGLSGLKINHLYYLKGNDGSLTLSNTGIPFGVAISTTQIKIMEYAGQAENLKYLNP